MPKKFLKKFLPDPHELKKHAHLQVLGSWLHDPNIWHLNRNSVARAFSVGLFCAFIPVPFQMLISAFFAILFRANLPLSVVLVWITNPVTMPPMFYGAYKFGSMILGHAEKPMQFELSYYWLSHQLLTIWQPFLLGCFLLGLISAVLANIAIRIIWRLHVIQRWKNRKLRIQENKRKKRAHNRHKKTKHKYKHQ